jgi:hypothetical protein
MAAVIVAVLLSGGAALYFYTSPQVVPTGAASITSSRTGTLSGNEISGYQDSSGLPYGTWSTYLGYIPQGYLPVPHQSNAPLFPCPPDMSSSACAQFQQTCGNGVCDPNEACSSCPIDCAPSGNLVCDPYTGRSGMPASVCQAVVGGNNFG